MSTTAPKLPLTFDNGAIDSFEDNEIKELIKQNVKMIILTNPGERIMMPAFGVGLLQYLFDQSTSTSYIGLEMIIKNQLNRYIPSINLTSVSVTAGNDEQRLNVFIAYDIDFLQTRDQLDLLVEY
jgi:hypothetical protein